MNKISEFDMVSIMNEAFGNPKGERQYFMPVYEKDGSFNYVVEAWDRVERQLSNVMDEIKEFRTALQSKDVNGARDALCDIRVFAYGGAHFLGIDYDSSEIYKISSTAPIPMMLGILPPVMALEAAHHVMMDGVAKRDYDHLVMTIRLMIWTAFNVSDRIHLEPEQQYDDFKAVIDGVMTRFIKDKTDLLATMAKFETKGVATFYTEGEYPTMILKSAADYPDAPKGKFLKAVSYKDTVFAPLNNAEEVETFIGYVKS